MKQFFPDERSRHVISLALAMLLLVATMAWHVPMMLWDHLDLVPMYDALQQGNLWASDVVRVHDGSHLHLTAYLVLLATTFLSGGQTWLDCLVNWVALMVYAVLLVRLMAQIPIDTSPQWLRLAMVGLVLYPGHMANLQWGWQIAVFLCLIGVAVAVVALSTRELSWRWNLLALAAMVMASLSFTTGLALVPMAIVLISFRTELSRSQRGWLLLPWCVLGAAFAALLMPDSEATGAAITPGPLIAYAMNFLGGGIARFATGAAPLLVLLTLASAVWFALRLKHDIRRLAWIGWMVFAIGAGVLTAFGRATAFGADHAFVTRYVSFSSLFWIGWFGLLLLALPDLSRRWRSSVLVLAGLITSFAVLNGLHMVKKAHEVAARASETAQLIRSQYPSVDQAVLKRIYFGRVDAARQRLQRLHALGFAPFEPAALKPAEHAR